MIAAIALIAVAVIYRIILNTAGAEGAGWIANFAPFAAIAFCGAIYLPKRFAFAIPLVALLISDLVINAVHGISLFSGYMVARYAALALVAGIGLIVRKRRNPATIGAGTIGGTLTFYLITNTASWLAEPGYAKSVSGWVQALTVGLPGYAPTWMFLRNSLISDLIFTALFVSCITLAGSRASHQSPRRLGTVRS